MKGMNILDYDFYNRDTLKVAPELLGKYLVRKTKGHLLIGKIVETEAYIGPIDKGAHTYNYKRTLRTEAMFGPPGHSYIYLIYGMYYCLNAVTEREGEPCAVLIRGIEPIKGKEQMSFFRYGKSLKEITNTQKKNLTNGPGKICMAFNIDKELNGESLRRKDFHITYGETIHKSEIVKSKRINIDYAEEAKDFLWRYTIKNNPHVSKKI